MSRFRRWGVLGTIVLSTGALSARGEDWTVNRPKAAAQSPGAAVDLSGATMSSHATTSQTDLSAPIVEAASKKKKAPPSLWNRMWHPTQWFSSSKSKK